MPVNDQALFDEINTLHARLKKYEDMKKKYELRVKQLLATCRGLDKQNKWYRAHFGNYQGERRIA